MKKYFLILLMLFMCHSAWADFQVATGTITTPTSASSAAVTGLSFTPKIILVYGNITTTRGFTHGFGAASSSTSRWALSGFDDNNQQSTRNIVTNQVVSIYQGAVKFLEGDLVSLDSGGFTINWTTVQASGQTLYYTALGGSSLSASVGNFTSNAGIGSQAITGTGFLPATILLMTDGNSTTGETTTSLLALGIGNATNTNSIASVETSLSNNSFTQQLTGTLISRVNGSGVVSAAATLTSLDSNGFTLNWSIAASYVYGYIALNGISAAQGTLAQPSSTGNQSVSSLSFSPSIIFLLSDEAASSVSVNSGNSGFAFGSGVSSSSRTSYSIVHSGVNNNYGGAATTSKLITHLTAGNPSTTAATADLVSLDSSGFTINWTTADATAREAIYWALGPASALRKNTFFGDLF